MLVLRGEAERDIRGAYAWYEGQRENLGKAFLAEVERTLEAIQEYPDAHVRVFKSVQRALCKRFPYAIYFVRREPDVVVLAVLHQRRRPATWQKRI